jgi:hypothetical protein
MQRSQASMRGENAPRKAQGNLSRFFVVRVVFTASAMTTWALLVWRTGDHVRKPMQYGFVNGQKPRFLDQPFHWLTSKSSRASNFVIVTLANHVA